MVGHSLTLWFLGEEGQRGSRNRALEAYSKGRESEGDVRRVWQMPGERRSTGTEAEERIFWWTEGGPI